MGTAAISKNISLLLFKTIHLRRSLEVPMADLYEEFDNLSFVVVVDVYG